VAAEPVLRVDRLAAGYGALPVLFNVSISVSEGEVVAVAAGNGAGKSTLLASISGLLRPVERGDVVFGGHDVTTRGAHQICRLGLVHVLERRRLAPFMSVIDNLRLSEAAVSRGERANWRRRFEECVKSQPIVRTHGKRKARELSGGQQQLVAILRGMLAAPRVLLLDEPFQGLDRTIVAGMRDLLLEARAAGCGILLTEHRAEIVEGLADRTLRLERGEIVDEIAHGVAHD
jgi:branched-chain amino acid transport system ATP-binding protein